MTVSYNVGQENFSKLLLRWRGSLWRSVGMELTVWLLLFAIISLIYRLLLSDDQKRIFELYVGSFDKATSYIPVEFTLGFYVSAIYSRYWQQFNLIIPPDKLLHTIAMGVRGKEHETEKAALRRIIARYINLSNALGWRFISTKVLKRFPTDHYFVKAGLMTEQEYDVVRRYKIEEREKYVVPVLWILGHLSLAKKSGLISSMHFHEATKEIARLKDSMRKLQMYAWINTPLVYTQFTEIDPTGAIDEPLDWYFPVFSTLQFMFYVGWLKVGEQLFNPFGEDDIDFEMNYLLDRFLQSGFAIVESVRRHKPQLVETFPNQKSTDIRIPRTKASLECPDIVARSSVEKLKLDESEMEIQPNPNVQA